MTNAGMPQLDFATFPTQLFWLAVTFIILYVLMKWLVLPQVAAMIKARRDQLDADLASAEQLKAEAEAALAAYQQALATARAQAQAVVKQTTDRMAAAKERALSEIHQIAIEVGLAVTERITGSAPDTTKMEAAVDRAMAEHAS